MTNNDLFEEINEKLFLSSLKYFTINYILNFLYIIFGEKSFNKKFLLTGNIIITKQVKII